MQSMGTQRRAGIIEITMGGERTFRLAIFLPSDCLHLRFGPPVDHARVINAFIVLCCIAVARGGSEAEWLACWTQAQKGPGSNRLLDAVG